MLPSHVGVYCKLQPDLGSCGTPHHERISGGSINETDFRPVGLIQLTFFKFNEEWFNKGWQGYKDCSDIKAIGTLGGWADSLLTFSVLIGS